ncbi:MAG: extracellular solute-binding protein [bacterium]
MEKFTLVIVALLFVLTVFFLAFGSVERDPNDLVIWTQDLPAGRVVLDTLLARFQRQNPGIRASEIYYETEEIRSNFIIAAQGGSGPDLVYGPADMVGVFHVLGIIQPLNDFFSAAELAQFDPIAPVKYQGNLYLLADRVGNHLTLVYNKKLVPHPPRTSAELMEMGRHLSKDTDGDGKIDQYALAWNFIEPFFFIPFLGGYGGWVMDGEAHPTLNTPATIAACEFIVRLREEKIVPHECDLNLVNQLFKQNNAAMVINGPWSWGGYLDAGIDIGVTRIPMVSETGLWPTPMVSATGYCLNVNVTGERRERALKLLRFLIAPKNQLEYTRALRAIPSSLEARQDSIFVQDQILLGSQDQISVGRAMPIDPEMRAIWDAMRPAYQSILNGQLTPEQAAKKMQDDATKLIAEMFEE